MGKIEQEYADRFTPLFAPEIHNFSTSVGPFWERTQSGLEVEGLNNQAVYWICAAIPRQTRLEYNLADQGRLSQSRSEGDTITAMRILIVMPAEEADRARSPECGR